MTELQEARAKWLEAEEKIISLNRELLEAHRKNCELQMGLNSAEAQLRCLRINHEGLIRGLLGFPAHGR